MVCTVAECVQGLLQSTAHGGTSLWGSWAGAPRELQPQCLWSPVTTSTQQKAIMPQQGMPFSPACLTQVPCLQTGERSHPSTPSGAMPRTCSKPDPQRSWRLAGCWGGEARNAQGRSWISVTTSLPPGSLSQYHQSLYPLLRAGSSLRYQSERITQLLPAPECPQPLPSP